MCRFPQDIVQFYILQRVKSARIGGRQADRQGSWYYVETAGPRRRKTEWRHTANLFVYFLLVFTYTHTFPLFCYPRAQWTRTPHMLYKCVGAAQCALNENMFFYMFFTENEPRRMSLRLKKVSLYHFSFRHIENGSHRPEHHTRVKNDGGHCVQCWDLQCCRNLLVPFPVPQNNPVSELYGQFLWPHGLVFALTCTVNCVTLQYIDR